MRKLLAIPTWLLTMLSIKANALPVGHSWRGRSFSLKDWYEHQTDLCRGFDYLFWAMLPAFLIAVYRFADQV